MRILRVAPWIYPDSKGGGQYHVHAMSRDQAAMGHDVTVVTTRDDESLPVREETDGYTIVRVPKGITVAGNDISHGVARYLWKRAEEYDVIHAHSHLYFSTNLSAAYRRLDDVPLAITNHGLYSQSAPEWVFKVYLRTLGRWTFNQADMVFCYTETDKQRVRDIGVSSRIKVVPNGIDTERFTPEGTEISLVNGDGPIVLFVGRLVDGKRPSMAVEAFAEILTEYPNAELFLCGDGPLREDLIMQARALNIQESVTFLGHVTYDKMPSIYRSSDILVLPSRAEGVPRTVLEAMASGVPVVVSELDQFSGVIGEGGQSVSIESVDAFAEAISEMLKSNHSARNLVVENHRWPVTVEQATAHLHSLVRYK